MLKPSTTTAVTGLYIHVTKNSYYFFFPKSGLPSQAFEYIHYNGGIEREQDYKYVGRDEKCRFNSSKVAATVSQIHNFTQVCRIYSYHVVVGRSLAFMGSGVIIYFLKLRYNFLFRNVTSRHDVSSSLPGEEMKVLKSYIIVVSRFRKTLQSISSSFSSWPLESNKNYFL